MIDNELEAGRVYGTQSMDKPNRERHKCRELERVDAELRIAERRLKRTMDENAELSAIVDRLINTREFLISMASMEDVARYRQWLKDQC